MNGPFAFACQVVELHRQLWHQGGTGRVLAGQLLRSGTAVGANREEGKAGRSRADCIVRYNLAHTEARETHNWLRLLSATSLAPVETVAPRTAETNELVAILILTFHFSLLTSRRAAWRKKW